MFANIDRVWTIKLMRVKEVDEKRSSRQKLSV